MGRNGRRASDGHRDAVVTAVIGRVRSGTTVFRRLLASHPAIEDRGEILAATSPGNFWDWLERRARFRPALVRPERQVDEFARFIRGCARSCDAATSHVLVDIKLESTGTLGLPWQQLDTRPALGVVVQECRPIIFLRRRDQLARFVSNRRAISSGTYHADAAQGPAAAGPPPIDFSEDDLKYLRVRLQRNTREEDELVSDLRRWAPVHEFWYEDAFDDDGNFVETLTSELAALLEVEDRFDRRPTLARTAAGSVWDAFVDPALARRVLGSDE